MLVCEKCVINSSVPSFVKYKNSCSFCKPFAENLKIKSELIYDSKKLNILIDSIKKNSKKNKYDCVVGLSGGVDSAWALMKAKEVGLNPLAVHMDNGWNSELAQNNIQVLLENLKVDLYTHVIEWEEYASLMEAFFAADVIDVELLMDNAMLAVNYKMADKLGTQIILTGSNSATEGIRMPPGWIWHKFDRKNIYSIANAYGIKKLKSFPSIGNLQKLYYERIKGIRWVSFLDYFPYSREKALDDLQSIGFKPYPYKHYESVFTRFYQSYILPNKFNVDKRLIHLSAQIISNEITRDEALKKLKDKPCSVIQEKEDIDYFLTKLGWNEKKLKEYISRPPRSHLNFKSEGAFADNLVEFVRSKILKKS